MGRGGGFQSLALKIYVISDYYEIIMNYSYLFKPLQAWDPHYPHWQTGGELRRGNEYERAACWPCKCRAGSRPTPVRRGTICLKCILNSQATADAQQPRPPRQQPVERRNLRRCELRTAEIDFERVCDEVRRGKSSLGSTCTDPRSNCVKSDEDVDPPAAPCSSCTHRPSSSDIPI